MSSEDQHIQLVYCRCILCMFGWKVAGVACWHRRPKTLRSVAQWIEINWVLFSFFSTTKDLLLSLKNQCFWEETSSKLSLHQASSFLRRNFASHSFLLAIGCRRGKARSRFSRKRPTEIEIETVQQNHSQLRTIKALVSKTKNSTVSKLCFQLPMCEKVEAGADQTLRLMALGPLQQRICIKLT